jgi:tetratricopeptide (TPR) repeat protein
MLSDSLIGKGLVAWQLKRFAEAEQAYQRAHEQLSLSLAQHPDDIDCLLSLGTLHINWGLVASEADWPELAVTRLRKAVELLEGLYQREPKLVRLRLPLYNALGATHTELAKQNQFVEAARLAARQALFARPDQVCANWGNSAKYWALAGNKTECLAAATKARETSGNAWPTFWASWSTDPAFNPYRESEEWKKLGP